MREKSVNKQSWATVRYETLSPHSQHWQGNVGSDIKTSCLWIWLHPTLYHWTAREYFLPGGSLSIQVQPDQGSN